MAVLRRRLKTKSFQDLFAKGRFIRGRRLSILIKPNCSFDGGFGVTLKKKKRDAVTRNYMKRRLREAFFRVQNKISVEIDVVIIANDASRYCSIDDLAKEILFLVNKAFKRGFNEAYTYISSAFLSGCTIAIKTLFILSIYSHVFGICNSSYHKVWTSQR